MSHSNISIFVPHAGCPHMCSFCDQRTISGSCDMPDGGDVERICSAALEEIADRFDTEIAFFGGSFTAIDRGYMLSLLRAAAPFVGKDGFRGIRISTRPDYIDGEVLDILKEYGATSIELGAQSMDDEVLAANERGHTSADVERASALIRRRGFELGLQMMTGLYKSSAEKDMQTAHRIAALAPDTVRIYPVVVLEGTRLAQLFRQGEYVPDSFEDMLKLCARLVRGFENEGIKVIKCGLHASGSVQRDMVAGFYHPAFRELCDMYIYRAEIENILKEYDSGNNGGSVVIEVNDRCISRAVGQKKANTAYFKELGYELTIRGNGSIRKYECRLRK